MDAASTPQTVAEAVQAATQQQSQQLAAPSPPSQAPSAQSSTIDNLTCQWQGCGERCDTAESLYDHVCERHVGRKSTNNLNLTCQWGACRTTTVKRDHITSHIRVHVPLKPHKCDFCGKAFKRPQDLKKHVKTHADDSVLMNSPSQGNARSSMGANGMGQQNGKPGYYPASHDGGMGPYPSYQSAIGANGQSMGAYPPANAQYAGYGSVNYPNNNMQDLQSMDTRRRAIEALNDFLGDIKRRAIDPQNYYDVGHRLQSSALPLPVGGGYNTGYSNSGGYSSYNAASLLDAFGGGNMGGGGGGSGGASMHGPNVGTQNYSLPNLQLPNARTKGDLQDIDRFLEQLQATVYETSNHSAAAGVQQPGVHSIHTGDWNLGGAYRNSHSPPSYGNNNAGGMSGVSAVSGVGSMPGVIASSSALDTPALTPASVSSYSSSGHSPMSSHSRSSLSSMGGSQMYPSLPSVTGMSDLGAGYPTTTSAPASGLASGFEGLDGRRYSGGRLQRVAPSQDTEMADADDGSRTPKASEAARPKSKGNSSIDPALRGEGEKTPSDSASTPAAETEEEKGQEGWVENIRVIELLRKYLAHRLETDDYEEDGTPEAKEGASDDAAKLAQLVEEKMADAPEVKDENEADVKYPALPTATA